jgi:voltage-gated potassium channel
MSSTLDKTQRVFGSPMRNLASILVFMAVVIAAGVAAYMAAGWSLADASYMVALTIYTVGYGEVRPIDTAYLHGVTMALMVLGCTGMILLTSALVQLMTAMQLRQFMGSNRMHDRIRKLSDHVIICGYGRIGVMLARDLAAAGTPLVVLDRDTDRLAEAEAAGHLVQAGEATEEEALIRAGVARARTLATVLPDDAANVFITLSARNLNPQLEIIARGEVPSTESKLRHAGANQVVLPTHIGAERIARMILYPESSAISDEGERERLVENFGRIGLALERVTVADRSSMVGLTVSEAERRGNGAFFIVGLATGEREAMTRPDDEARLQAGSVALVLTRQGVIAPLALFKIREGVRAGRNLF